MTSTLQRMSSTIGQNLATLSLVLTFSPALDIIDMAMTEQQDNSEEKGKSVQNGHLLSAACHRSL